MEKSEWQQLTQRTRHLKATDISGAKYFILDLILTGLAIAGSLQGSIVVWVLSQLLLFVCTWRWFSILHSCVHGAFFKTPWINEIVGHVASVLSLVPYRSWKKSHLAHHKWVGWREMDPSLSLPHPDEISSRFKKILNLCWRFHIPVFIVLTTVSKLSKVKEKNNSSESFFQSPTLSHWIFYGSHGLLIAFLQWDYLKVFVLPILAYLITADIFVISQHNDMELPSLKGDVSAVPLHDQDRWTRTLRFPRWISAYFFLWFDKHTLHHFLPFIPHYRLEEVGDAGIKEVDCIPWVRAVKKKEGYKVYLQ